MNRKSNDFVCALNPKDFQERRLNIIKILGDLNPKVEEQRNGYKFTFSVGDNVFKTLVEFIEYERKCCPFLEFCLQLNLETVSLRISGKKGVKSFLSEELQILEIGDKRHGFVPWEKLRKTTLIAFLVCSPCLVIALLSVLGVGGIALLKDPCNWRFEFALISLISVGSIMYRKYRSGGVKPKSFSDHKQSTQDDNPACQC
jgi:hypothetical protein